MIGTRNDGECSLQPYVDTAECNEIDDVLEVKVAHVVRMHSTEI